MKGNIKWQVQTIYLQSGINQIGESKHRAKETVRQNDSLTSKSVTWHEIGKKIGIHSYATADAYRAVWRQVGQFAKENFKIRDIEKITGDHIQKFLEAKIDQNVSLKTFAQYASACEKLETAMNGYAAKKGTGKTYQFSKNIQQTRNDARNILNRFDQSRAYSDPKKIIENLKGTYKIVAQIQLESGARINESTHIKEKNLLGFEKDPFTNEEKGKIKIEQAKGGFSGMKYVSKETYKQLHEKIQASENKMFKFSKQQYLKELKKAADVSDQKYNGSHGLRWNFAQERFQEVQIKGDYTYEQALLQVSQEMFHHRGNITEHYLK